MDQEQKTKLAEALSPKKNFDLKKAENDAEMMLAIYFLRKKQNESSSSGIFGYKTWWLSKDTSTFKALKKCFGADMFPISCYIRPDFIYNYIAMKPSHDEIDDAYKEIFPTMLGVNLSYHMPHEVSKIVQEKIREYHDKPPVRVKQIIKTLSDRLKSDSKMRNRVDVELFLDKELKKLQNGVK